MTFRIGSLALFFFLRSPEECSLMKARRSDESRNCYYPANQIFLFGNSLYKKYQIALNH